MKKGSESARPQTARSSGPEPAPAGAAGPFPWRRFGLIVAGSALLGVICVLQYRHSPNFSEPILDEASYVQWARQISGGDWLGDRIFYQDPLYPYFLAVIFRCLGESYLVVRLIQVLLGSAAVGLCFMTGRTLFNDRVAGAAAVMMSLLGSLYFFELQLTKGALVIFLAALACALGAAAGKRPGRLVLWPAVGAALGLLTLLRGNFLLVIPWLIGWVLWRGGADPLRRRLLRAALLAAGVALVLVPVSVRNYLVGHELVLTTSQGGANFYLGNNDRAEGSYTYLPFVRPDPLHEAMDFRAEAERRTGRTLSPSEVSRFWFREGLDWAASHPGRALTLTLHKARLLVHQFELPDNHNFRLTREAFVPALWLSFLGLGFLWGPALLGIFIGLRREPAAGLPAWFGLLYAASIIPFFVVDRYRLPLLPPLTLFAAVFLVWLIDHWKGLSRPVLAGVAVALAGTWLLGLWPIPESRGPRAIDQYNLGNSYLDLGRPHEALRWYDRAARSLPHDPDLTLNRTVALLQLNSRPAAPGQMESEAEYRDPALLKELAPRVEALGRPDMAAALYSLAVRQSPDFDTYLNLGRLECSAGKSLDPRSGLAHLGKALALEPDSRRASSLAAKCYDQLGDREEAERWRSRAAVAEEHR